MDRYRENLMRRRLGASPEARRKMKEANSAARNWTGRCRKCGQALEGTIAQILEHDCGS